MRFQAPITSIFNNKAKADCLRFLYKYPAELTGRQLAKMVKGAPATIHRVMQELSDEQVVTSRNVGNAHIYEINKKNMIVDRIIIPMFKEEDQLLSGVLSQLTQKIAKSPLKSKIISVALFGSVHEKRENPTSDIDIFILVHDSGDKKRLEDLIQEFGNEIHSQINMSIEPFVKTISEFQTQKETNIIKSIIRSHRIIYGEPLENSL